MTDILIYLYFLINGAMLMFSIVEEFQYKTKFLNVIGERPIHTIAYLLVIALFGVIILMVSSVYYLFNLLELRYSVVNWIRYIFNRRSLKFGARERDQKLEHYKRLSFFLQNKNTFSGKMKLKLIEKIIKYNE